MKLRSGRIMDQTQTAPGASTSEQNGDSAANENNMMQKLMEMLTSMNSSMGEKLQNINTEMSLNKIQLEETINTHNTQIDQRLEKFEENMRNVEVNISKRIEENNQEFRNKIENLETEWANIKETTTYEITMTVREATQDIRNEVMMEVEKIVGTGIEQMDKTIREQGQTYDKKLNEQECKILENTKMLKDGAGRQTTTHNYACNKTPFYFYGDSRIHPKIFITRLRHQLDILHSEDELKATIQSMIKGDADYWFQMVESKFNNIEEFEVLVLKQYWSEYVQQKVRQNLYNGKYNDRSGISRENYVLRKVYNIRHLEPKFTEGEMVRYLARHFTSDIQNVIITQRISTFDELIEYIREIDDYRPNFNQNVQNSQNINRFNNNEGGNQFRRYNDDRENQIRYNYYNNQSRYNNNNGNYGNRNNGNWYFNSNKGNDKSNFNRYQGNENNREQQNYNLSQYNKNSENKTLENNVQNYDRKQVRWDDRRNTYDDNRRDGKTYAHVANTNLIRENKGNDTSKVDYNKIETVAQINERTGKQDF